MTNAVFQQCNIFHVGAASVTATYATAGVFGVIFTPVIIRKLGPKMCLLFCELAYMIFIVMNAYPGKKLILLFTATVIIVSK